MKSIIINLNDDHDEENVSLQDAKNDNKLKENINDTSKKNNSIKINNLKDFDIATSNEEESQHKKKNIIIEKIKENPSIQISNQDIPNIKDLEIIKQLESIKKRKKLLKISIIFGIILFIIGIIATVYYYRIQIANILYPPKLQKHSEKIVQKVEIKLKELGLIEQSKIKKGSLAEKYYPLYKDDFLLIYDSPLPKELKKRLLIKLNLIMYKIIKEDGDYFSLKLQFDKFEIKMLNLLKNGKK